MQVPPGHAILFCGYTMHTGVPITAGTRYVLTGFVGGRPLSFTPALASLVRYVLTGFVDFRAAVEAVRPFYGPIPGALPTPALHAECSARRPHPSLHTAPSQARHPLPNCMLSASLSSQARCPHFVWSGQRACKCSAWRPHPSLHRHAAHSVWSGQQRLPLATPRHEPRAPLPRLWRRPR
jgi:hypothetical protein